MESAVFGFLGAIIGSILGFVGSLLSTFGKARETQHNVITHVITKERSQWRSDMRNLTAELIVVATELHGRNDDKLLGKFNELRIKIRLRLNPYEGHKYDEVLLDCLNGLSEHFQKGTAFDFNTKLEEFESNMQKLIKKEWDKSKKEAESGNMGVPDKYT
ncbi:hypothetical protein CTB58_003753 [Vibrio mimicus]